MQKDEKLFDEWNILKQKIDQNIKNIYPKHKEVWYISMWINIWYESNWKWNEFKRPVLILSRIWNTFLVVSMTTKWKENNEFYFELDKKYFNRKSFLNLSQFKTIDKKRFIKKIWKFEENDFIEIKKRIKKLI